MTRILHCHEFHVARDPSEASRMERARNSWRSLGFESRPYGRYRRSAKDVGDSRELPFLVDCLADGVRDADERDIVLFTNSDIIIHPSLPGFLRLFIAIHECCTAMRVDFQQGSVPDLNILDYEDIGARGQPHLGRDLFAASAAWLMANWDELPDSIIGAPEYDLQLAAMVRQSKGFETTRKNIDTVIPCCELPKGLILHEAHRGQWETLPESTPSHRWNRAQFQKWANEHAPEMRVPL